MKNWSWCWVRVQLANSILEVVWWRIIFIRRWMSSWGSREILELSSCGVREGRGTYDEGVEGGR